VLQEINNLQDIIRRSATDDEQKARKHAFG
jgi:hypothetical protein